MSAIRQALKRWTDRSVWSVLLVIAFSGAIAENALDRWTHEAGDLSRLLSVPPPSLVEGAAGGFKGIVADLLFLRFVDYWGYRLTHGRKFTNLAPILDEVTTLSPDLWTAWDIGSLALADAGEIDAMRAFLARGEALHPGDPRFPYQRGLMTFLFSDRYRDAGVDFERAARLPGAPKAALFFAARMYGRAGQRDLAIATWQRIRAANTSPEVRKVADRALVNLHNPRYQPR